MNVPTETVFDAVYPDEAKQAQMKRWNQLLADFETRYEQKADFISRSPGRVNIIGEHVDYSLYECVPMAVTADVILAVSPRADQHVRIANSNSEKFPERHFEIPPGGDMSIDAAAHDWSNYFKAGLKGASGQLRSSKGENFAPMGMNVLVNGSVPTGGGLSSSAAFVCASALAVLWANGIEAIGKKELVELAIVSERSVGVNSGGLDQAASVFPQRGEALHVSFTPTLNATPISFPSTSLTFLIAQSFVESNKQVTGPIHYNLRVVECTLAALVLARIFRVRNPLPGDAGPLGISLRGFHDTYMSQQAADARNASGSGGSAFAPDDYGAQLEHLISLVDNYLIQEEGYSREQLADLLGLTIEQLEERYMRKVPVRAQRFKLRQRALHVFSEALRVHKFMALLRDADTSGQGPAEDDNDKLKELPRALGTLLNETQDSCRDLYECSTPELDALCEIAVRAGSFGSRLTGAGWGGCTVHLVPADKVDRVKAAWRREYYEKRFPDMSDAEIDEAVVVSRPGRGSLLWEVAGRSTVEDA